MKLFKKLAAAALAAVLALSMVGCGAGGTGSALDLKNEVLNLVEDTYYMSGKTATHTTAMDTEAAKLIESAAKQKKAIIIRCKNFCKSTTRAITLRSLRPSCVQK